MKAFARLPLYFSLTVTIIGCEILRGADSGRPPATVPAATNYEITASPSVTSAIEGIAAYTSFSLKDKNGKITDVSHLAVPTTATGISATKVLRNNTHAWRIEANYEIDTKIIWTFPELGSTTVEVPTHFRKAGISSLTGKGCESEMIAGMEYFPSLIATLTNRKTLDVTSSATWSVEVGQQLVELRPTAVPSFRTRDEGQFVLKAEVQDQTFKFYCSVGDAIITKLEAGFIGNNTGLFEVFSGTTINLFSRLTFSNDRVIVNDPRVTWSQGVSTLNGNPSFTPTSLSGLHKDFTVSASLEAGTAIGVTSNVLNLRAKTVAPTALEIASSFESGSGYRPLSTSLAGSAPLKMFVAKKQPFKIFVRHNNGTRSPADWGQVRLSSHSAIQIGPDSYRSDSRMLTPMFKQELTLSIDNLPNHAITIVVDDSIPSIATNGANMARFAGLQNNQALALVDYDGTSRTPGPTETISFQPTGFLKFENGKISFLNNPSKSSVNVKLMIESPRYGRLELGNVTWCPRPTGLGIYPHGVTKTYAANPIQFKNSFKAEYPLGADWENARSMCSYVSSEYLSFQSSQVNVQSGCINRTTTSAVVGATLMPGVSGTSSFAMDYYPSVQSLTLNGTELGINSGRHKITVPREKMFSYGYQRMNFSTSGAFGYRSPSLNLYAHAAYQDPQLLSNPVTSKYKLSKGFYLEISGASPVGEVPCHIMANDPVTQISPMRSPYFIAHTSRSPQNGTNDLGYIQYIHRARMLFCGAYIGRACDSITTAEFEELDSRARGTPYLGTADYVIEIE